MVTDVYKVLKEWPKKGLLFLIFAEAYVRDIFNKKKSSRLIIVKIDVVGDFILFSTFIPAYADLYKGYRISLVVNVMCLELAQKICASIPQIDRIIPFDRQKFDDSYLYKIRFFRTLLKEGGSIAIQPAFSRSYVGDILARMTNASERIGYRREPCDMSAEQKHIDDTFYTRLIDRNEKTHSEIDANTYFLTRLGGEIKDPLPHLSITDEEKGEAQKILEEHGLSRGKNVF